MKNNGVPEETEFVLIGGSVYLRIPPNRLSHLDMDKIKQDDKPNRFPAKTLAEETEQGESYMSYWNPNSDSQQGGNQ